MTLTFGQGHRSRSNIQKSAKIYKMGNISDAISPTDFILGTKVQPNKAHLMTHVPMTLTLFVTQLGVALLLYKHMCYCCTFFYIGSIQKVCKFE